MLSWSYWSIAGFLSLLVSLALFFVCSFIVQYETTYDTFVSGYEDIYRVESVSAYDPNAQFSFLNYNFPVTSFELRSKVLDHFHNGAVEVVRFNNQRPYSLIAASGRKHVISSGMSFDVDENIFDFFDIDLVKGERHAALDQPNNIVLSSSQANAYFENNPYEIGSPVHLLTGETLLLSGVFVDLPNNSHMKLMALRPVLTKPASIKRKLETSESHENFIRFVSNDTNTYVKLNNISRAEFENFLNENLREKTNDGNLVLLPLQDIHLKGLPTIGKANGNIFLNYTLAILAFIIIIIAISNFFILQRLEISRGQKRLSLQKCFGYSPINIIRSQMVGSILSVVLTVIFISISIIFIYYFLKPEFDFALPLSVVFTKFNIIFIFLVCGLVIGTSTPIKFYRDAFKKPAHLIERTKENFKLAGLYFRFIVSLQFCIGYILILSLYQINYQIHQIKNFDRGINTADIYQLAGIFEHNALGGLTDQSSDLYFVASQAKSMGLIEGVTLTSGRLPGRLPPPSLVRREGERDKNLNMPVQFVEPGFFKFFDIKILAGRSLNNNHIEDKFGFSTKSHADPFPVVISEYAANLFGYKTHQEVIGENFKLFEGSAGTFDENTGKLLGLTGEVVGISEDVYFGRHTKNYNPVIYMVDSSKLKYLYVKTNNKKGLDDVLKVELDRTMPSSEMKAISFERALINLTSVDEKLRKFTMVLCILSLLVVILATYNLYINIIFETRKTTAIRRVVGYTNVDIIKFLSIQLLAPVAVGIGIGFVTSTIVNVYWFSPDQLINWGAYYVVAIVVALSFIGVSISIIYLITNKLTNTSPIQTLNNNSFVY